MYRRKSAEYPGPGGAGQSGLRVAGEREAWQPSDRLALVILSSFANFTLEFCDWLSVGTVIIRLEETVCARSCRTIHLRWAACDLLVFYTHGITEAQNGAGGDMFGIDRFGEAVTIHRADDPEILVSSVLAALNGFAGGMQHEDDLTIVVMKTDRVIKPSAMHTPAQPDWAALGTRS